MPPGDGPPPTPGAPPTPVPGATAAPGPGVTTPGVPVPAAGTGDAVVAAAAAAPLVPLFTLHLEIIRGICCKWS